MIGLVGKIFGLIWMALYSSQFPMGGITGVSGGGGGSIAGIGVVISTNTVPSGSINTTGATVVVVECSQFNVAPCGAAPTFGTADTYTLFQSCSFGSSKTDIYYSTTFTPGATTWTAGAFQTLDVRVYSGTLTSSPLYWTVGGISSCQNASAVSSTVNFTMNSVNDAVIATQMGLDGNVHTFTGTNITLTKQVENTNTGIGPSTTLLDNCLATGACTAASNVNTVITWTNTNGDESLTAIGIKHQ